MFFSHEVEFSKRISACYGQKFVVVFTVCTVCTVCIGLASTWRAEFIIAHASLLAVSGSSVMFNYSSICIRSFTSRSYLALPTSGWLLSCLRWAVQISGFFLMKMFVQRYLIRGSEKKLLRIVLLLSLKIYVKRIWSTESHRSGDGRRTEQGKTRVSIFWMDWSSNKIFGRQRSLVMNV